MICLVKLFETMPGHIAFHKMLEPLRDPTIVLDKIVTTKNVHERVHGSSDTHVYKKHQGVKTARLTVHGLYGVTITCLLYTSPSPRDLSTSRMPSSA